MRPALKILLLSAAMGWAAPVWSQSCWQNLVNRVLGRWDMPSNVLPFKSDEFPHSEMWHQRRSRLFPSWMAHVASAVTRKVHQGTPLSIIFEYVAQERQELARRMFSPPITDFGHRRDRKRGKFWFHSHVSFVNPDDQTDLEYALFSELIKPILRQGGSRQRLNTKRYPKNIYYTSQGHPIRTSQLFATKYEFRIRHPLGVKSTAIFTDVIFRLEQIRSRIASGESPAQLHQEFLIAMAGYYIAAPYLRGSAAIGRAFFEGFFLAVFGRKMPHLPEAIDIRAMLTTSDTFVNTFLPYFSPDFTATPAPALPTIH